MYQEGFPFVVEQDGGPSVGVLTGIQVEGFALLTGPDEEGAVGLEIVVAVCHVCFQQLFRCLGFVFGPVDGVFPQFGFRKSCSEIPNGKDVKERVGYQWVVCP